MHVLADQRLEDNELAFIHQHRSASWDLGFARLFVSSDRTVRTWNFMASIALDEKAESGIERCRDFFAQWDLAPCLKVTPFTWPMRLDRALDAAGWQVAVTHDHMIHPDPAALPPPPPGVTVRAVSAPDEIRTFSEVQSAGFGAPEWFGWVHRVNLVNAVRSHQRFYVAEMAGEPVGVTLLLVTGEVAGLYAVATLPHARRRGVARALVHRAAHDARRLGASSLCLNTIQGGAAQSAFATLGFRSVFASRFYVPGD